MNSDQVAAALERGVLTSVEGVDPSRSGTILEHLSVDGLVAFPISACTPAIDRRNDVELVDENGMSFGTLCFTKSLRQVRVDELTRWQYVAYLADIEPEQLGLPYDFLRDYVVVDESFADKYKEKYCDGSPIWGGFTHSSLPARTLRSVGSFLVALPDISLPTPYHQEAFNRYVEATNGFDRYLKLYHCLELLFDFITLKRLQNLGDDLSGFSKIVSQFGGKEIDRIRYLVGEVCEDHLEIAFTFGLIAPFEDRAREIFQDHSKEGNPFGQMSQWTKFVNLAKAGQLYQADLKLNKFASDDDAYKTFVTRLISYWIYRVRSSIAHSRVGEFLFDESDESFVADFAERMLLEVVSQVLSSTKLRALLA